MTIIIADRFELGERIGAGSFGIIFKGYDMKYKRNVALKLESVELVYSQLHYEYIVYKKLVGTRGIPDVYAYIPGYQLSYGKFNILVMQLLGPSLEDLFQRCNCKFSLKTTLQLAVQLMEIIENIHNKSFLHRDMKPDNFLFDPIKKQIYIVDFGLAKQYRDSKTHVHIPYREHKSLIGTPRYASINTHLGIQNSRRDDLESLDYILLYFLRGSLPWQGFKARTKLQKYQKIMEKKLATPIELIHNNLPNELHEFATYARSLRFADKPDYTYLIQLFKQAALRNNITLDKLYDWDNLLNTINEVEEVEKDLDTASTKAKDAAPPNRIANSSIDNTKNPTTRPEYN